MTADFSTLESLEMQHALLDCKTKLADLDARIQAEFMTALQEGRKPYAVMPNTAIRAELVTLAIAKIGAPPETKVGVVSLKEICRAQKASCGKLTGETVALQSDQLAAILEAAGVKPLGTSAGGVIEKV